MHARKPQVALLNTDTGELRDQELSHVGDDVEREAAKIRAMVVRNTKTDRRDARHLRDLLKDDRFPVVWIPDPRTRDCVPSSNIGCDSSASGRWSKTACTRSP